MTALTIGGRSGRPISIQSVFPRPGNGPSGQAQTGQRVFAVAIVFSLLTKPARKITIPTAATVAASHPSTASRGSGTSFEPNAISAGSGREKNA